MLDRQILRRGLSLGWEQWRRGSRQEVLHGLPPALPFAAIGAMAWAGRHLDRGLYPDYRDQPIRAPVYIAAPARSGTTLIHHLLVQDDQFFSPLFYQTSFPAVSEQRAIQGLRRLDRTLGGRLSALFDRVNEWKFSGADNVHRTRLDEYEEDEPLFMMQLGSFSTVMLFPFASMVHDLYFLDDRPAQVRNRIMEDYLENIRRVLYCAEDFAPGRTLLAKNVHSAGRIRTLREHVPDARFIHIVRNPYEQIPSAIELIRSTFRTHRYPGEDLSHYAPVWREVGLSVMEYHRRLLAMEQESSPSSWVTLRFEDVVSDPRKSVIRIYERLGLEMRPEALRRVEALTREAHTFKNRSRYSLGEFGFTKDEIYRELKDVFEAYAFPR